MDDVSKFVEFILENVDADAKEDTGEPTINMDDMLIRDEKGDPDNSIMEDNETVEERMDRMNKYKNFQEIKEYFYRIRSLAEKRFKNGPEMVEIEETGREIDNFTEFYNKMSLEEKEEQYDKVKKKFVELLDFIKKSR